MALSNKGPAKKSFISLLLVYGVKMLLQTIFEFDVIPAPEESDTIAVVPFVCCDICCRDRAHVDRDTDTGRVTRKTMYRLSGGCARCIAHVATTRRSDFAGRCGRRSTFSVTCSSFSGSFSCCTACLSAEWAASILRTGQQPWGLSGPAFLLLFGTACTPRRGNCVQSRRKRSRPWTDYSRSSRRCPQRRRTWTASKPPALSTSCRAQCTCVRPRVLDVSRRLRPSHSLLLPQWRRGRRHARNLGINGKRACLCSCPSARCATGTCSKPRGASTSSIIRPRPSSLTSRTSSRGGLKIAKDFSGWCARERLLRGAQAQWAKRTTLHTVHTRTVVLMTCSRWRLREVSGTAAEQMRMQRLQPLLARTRPVSRHGMSPCMHPCRTYGVRAVPCWYVCNLLR